MEFLKKIIGSRVFRKFSGIVTPTGLVEIAVFYLVAFKAKTLNDEDASRFLLTLDTRLYSLQGMAAVRYGKGIHTKHRHMKYHDFFVNRLHQGERALDVGCGIGAVAYAVATRSKAEVVGIDLNADYIKKAQSEFQHPHVTYVYGDALKDLPEGRFDVVILSNVLEHIEQRVDFLSKLCSATHAKRLLIRVPSFERDWRVPLKKELGVDYRLDPTHFIEYTPELFEEEMQAAGLKIRYLESRWGELWTEVTPNLNRDGDQMISKNEIVSQG